MPFTDWFEEAMVDKRKRNAAELLTAKMPRETMELEPTSAQDALDILNKHFFGSDYPEPATPMTQGQKNTLIVYHIMDNF